MPKKKIQHKGQPREIAENCQDVEEEEYTTVVDYENNKKYSKRTIESNWAKYETNIVDVEDKEEEECPDDFNSLIKSASSDCSHFQFNSEKLWLKEDSFVPSSEIFNLDVNRLSKGLACLPFYKRIGMDESELSEEDKKYFDEKVEKSLEEYKKLLGQESCEEKKETKDVDLKVNVNAVNENLSKDNSKEKGSDGFETQTKAGQGDKKEKTKFFSENEENLEDWLDSVLDD